MTSFPPPVAGARPVLAVVADLLFRSKIDEVARRLGLELRVARSPEQLERHLAGGLEPAVALVDLEADTVDPGAAIARLKGGARTRDTRVIGFGGHTNLAALRAGRDSGADLILARSAFTAQLPALLGKVAAAERARVSGAGAAGTDPAQP